MIRSLEHIALSISDMEHSLAFYRDFIGMKIILEVDFSDDRIGMIVGAAGARCRVIHLKLGDTILELFQYYYPIGREISPDSCQWDNGFIHIGFRVTDIHKHIEQLKKRGIELLGKEVEIHPGAWVVYFRGPDGEVCEFRELPEK